MAVLAGGSGAFTIAFDDDLNMTAIPYAGVGASTLLRRIVRVGEAWYAGSTVGLLVFDGEKWTLEADLPRNGTNTAHLDVPYDAVACDGERLLVAGRNRRVMWRPLNGGWESKAQTASDPITYSAAVGKDHWVLGVVGQALTSSKDLSAPWSVWNLGHSEDMRVAVHGEGRYVLVSARGHVSTFTDQEGPAGRVGSHLDLPTMPGGVWARGANYGKGLFVVAGEGEFSDPGLAGNIYTSPDGINWTRRELSWPPGVEHTWYGAWTPLRDVTWTGRYFVAVGQAGKFSGGPAENGVAGIWVSPDGIEWEHRGIGIVTSDGMGPDLHTVEAQVKVRTFPPQRIRGRLRSRATAFA
jgi:hypothetical protein